MKKEPSNLAKAAVSILCDFKFAVLDVNSGECQFQQNMAQTGSFYDQFQQGAISLLTYIGLGMKEIRQEFSKMCDMIPSHLKLVFLSLTSE